MIALALFKMFNRKPLPPGTDAAERDRRDLVLLTKALTSKRLTEAKEILILGCGDGALCHLYAEHQAKLVVGVESRHEYQKSQKNLIREFPELPILFLNEPESRLPYPDGTFDIVLLSHILEYADDPKALLHEAARLLRPSGLLVLSITPKYSAHGCGTDLISMRHANLFFSRKTRTAFVAEQCKHLEDGETLRRKLLYTDHQGKLCLTGESRLTLASLTSLLQSIPALTSVKSIPIGPKLFCRIGGISEAVTERMITVLEKNKAEQEKKA